MEVLLGISPLQVRFSYLISRFHLSVLEHRKNLIMLAYEGLFSANSTHPRLREYLQVKVVIPDARN